MPIHDLRCPDCGRVVRDRFIPLIPLPEPDHSRGYVVKTRLGDRPWCSTCARPMEILPPRCAVDIYESASTTCEMPDGSIRQIHSLRDIRRAERDSAAQGQQMVWRDYSQNRSNHDAHTLEAQSARASQATLSKAAAARFGPAIQRSLTEPTVTLGPGVTEATMSPLGPGDD